MAGVIKTAFIQAQVVTRVHATLGILRQGLRALQSTTAPPITADATKTASILAQVQTRVHATPDIRRPEATVQQ